MTAPKENALIKRADRLLAQYQAQADEGVAWWDDVDGLRAWLHRYQTTCKRSTFLYYRKCLVYKARAEGYMEIAEEIARVGRLSRPAPTDFKALPNHLTPKQKHDVRSKRGLYAEEVTFAAIKVVMKELNSVRQTGEHVYKNGPAASALFKAGVLTGLRPVEWAGAILHESLYSPITGERHMFVLEVTTAKQNDVHCDEEDYLAHKRFLILDTFGQQDIDLIAFVIELASTSKDWDVQRRRFGKTFNYAAKACRKTIWEKTQLDGKLTMYTSRHIFASEVRRGGLSDKYELAAMMGHYDTYNQRYYGDLSGEAMRQFPSPLPRPWPGSAEAVKQRDSRPPL